MSNHTVRLENVNTDNNVLKFTLHAPSTAYPNAIRRTCLSSIPAPVFRTFPHERNLCDIKVNTTRVNNEIVKQRLSCIPIHIANVPLEFEDYILDLDIQNNSSEVMVVTTEHFRMKNLHTNEYLDDDTVHQIFPPFIPHSNDNKYFVEFLHLFPKISENIEGEHIKLTARFSTGTASEDGSYNMVSTIGVGFTPDYSKMDEELEKHKQDWKDKGESAEQIKFNAENWKLLEGLRYVIKNSYDFTIETVGTYSNEKLIIISCDILLDLFVNLYRKLGEESTEPIEIKKAKITTPNCFDILLPNDYHTISNILNANIVDMFYQNPDTSLNTVSYIGVKKMHPHDPDTLLRIAYFDDTSTVETARQNIISAIELGVKTIKEIRELFSNVK